MADPTQLESVFPKCGHPRSPENSYDVKSGGKTYPACRTCVKARSDARRQSLHGEGVVQRRGTKAQRDRIIATALEFYLDPTHAVSKRHVYYKLRTHDNTKFVASLQLTDSSADNFSALVCSALSEGCEDGRISYECFVDPSRIVKRRGTWSSKKEFLRQMERSWDSSDITVERPVHVECWIEKDALLSSLSDLCYAQQITLRSTKGHASDDMIYRASKDFAALHEGKAVEIFYYGDWDKSGQDIENEIRRKLTTWDMFGGRTITLTRLGLTALDADQLQIQDDPEVDALDDSDLQDRLQAAIKKIMRSKGKRR